MYSIVMNFEQSNACPYCQQQLLQNIKGNICAGVNIYILFGMNADARMLFGGLGMFQLIYSC